MKFTQHYIEYQEKNKLPNKEVGQGKKTLQKRHYQKKRNGSFFLSRGCIFVSCGSPPFLPDMFFSLFLNLLIFSAFDFLVPVVFYFASSFVYFVSCVLSFMRIK